MKIKITRKYQKKAKPKSKAPAKLSAPVTAAVKQIVRGDLENKYLTLFPGYVNAISPGLAWAAQGTGILQVPAVRNSALGINIVPLLPPLSQGVQQNQRIGDKVRPVSLKVDFTVSFDGRNVNSNVLACRLMCLKDKSIKTIKDLIFSATQPGTPVDQQLMDYGNGVNGGYNGLPYDQHWRINTERYSVISDLKFELRKSFGQTPHATNSVPYAGSLQFTDSTMTRQFSVTVPTPQTLLYSNDLDLYPTNFAPFWCIGFSQPDGDGTVDYLANAIMVNYTTHFVYEDA